MNPEEKPTRHVERPFDLQTPDVPDQRDPDKTRRVTDESRARIRDSRSNIDPELSKETKITPKVDTGKTQIYRGPRKSPEATDYHPLSTPAKPEDILTATDGGSMEDPVVGWLVVVKGPGRGQAVRIGSEWNSIGRDPDQRICLNFGDNHISRRNHARLNYEPLARKFAITVGDGINSTYVRGENLLGPTEIKAGDRIRMGDTELMFVPLCGESFDWNTVS